MGDDDTASANRGGPGFFLQPLRLMSQHCTVQIDLARVRANAENVRQTAGVPMIAVVKADAYGLGAAAVAKAIGDLVEAFYVFDAVEAVTANLWPTTGRRTIALNGYWTDPDDYCAQHIHPVVWTVDRAAALRRGKPVLSIDTGQQRFAAPAEQIESVQKAGDCREIMTHAVKLEQVRQFSLLTNGLADGLFRHAAGTALLSDPAARFDAVRPGLALYRGAARVTAKLVDARDSRGPAGYTGFTTPRFGVILAGYSDGLRPGPCRINGQPRRVIEVGMQSAFVELGPADRIGDPVVLLGDEPDVDEMAIARSWQVSPQEVLVRLTKLARLEYAGD